MPPSRLPSFVTAGRRAQALSAGVAVHGLDEALAFVRLFASHLLEQVEALFLEEAEAVANEARATAPQKSGRLQGTVRTKSMVSSSKVGVKVGAGGANAPYAGVVMFAHKASNPLRTNLTPNPFLIRAGEKHKEGVEERVTARLQSLINGTI